MTKKFKALESVKTDQGNQLSIIERSIDDLPEGELLIKVHYSSPVSYTHLTLPTILLV